LDPTPVQLETHKCLCLCVRQKRRCERLQLQRALMQCRGMVPA